MAKSEFEQFKQDIASHGLCIPILVLEGTDFIIDGRHRYEACCELGFEPQIEPFSGNDSRVLLKIVSLNSRRRHLSESQRAAVAAELATMSYRGNRKSAYFKEPIGSLKAEKTLLEAANDLSVGKSSVVRAKAVKTNFPEIWELIRLDEITVADAYKVCKESEEVKREILNHLHHDKKAGRNVKKLAQYRKEVKQQAAKLAVEKAATSILNIEVNESPRVNFGDTWQLGQHTLICCDSSMLLVLQVKM